jgi:hypothetical protein
MAPAVKLNLKFPNREEPKVLQAVVEWWFGTGVLGT